VPSRYDPVHAPRDRPLPCRLHGPAQRPPAPGAPAAAGQGGRLGAGPLRRRGVQAAQLDVAPVHPGPGARGLEGHQPQRRFVDHPDRGDPPRLLSRPGCRPRAGQGRRRAAPPGAAGRPVQRPGRRLVAGPARVPDRHRPGRPALPRRPGRLRRRRDQAPGRDRGPGAAGPVPGAPAARPRRRPRRARRPGLHPAGQDLAAARGINCVALDYDGLRGMEPNTPTLF
jgi:hypothetical protein